MITALAAFEARTVFLASPYPDSVNQAEADFLKSHGFQITAVLKFRLHQESGNLPISPENIVKAVVARGSEIKRNDVLFLTCTGLRAVDAVETLERELDLPVITSNSAALWLAMTRLGIDTTKTRVGRLFRLSPKGELQKTA